MEYVLDCLKAFSLNFTLVSSAVSKDPLPKETKKCEKGEFIFLKSNKAAPKKNIFLRLFNRLKHKKRLYNELLRNINDGDTLLVYHSLLYMNIIKKILKRKKITLILQVCEIYSDVMENDSLRKKEILYCKCADRFIFQSEQLNSLINIENKPYAILHGTYKVEEKFGSVSDDGIIHCVYAGTLDVRKGGAIAAASAAEFLPSNYHIHILGFGSDERIKETCKIIDDIQQKSKCKVSYDGCLQGDEYKSFIQRCQIGLSTQNPYAAFNSTSFPSKILVYLINGLKVVTADIEAVRNSSVGEHLYYYQEQDPKRIADAIVSAANDSDCDSKKLISTIDTDFKNRLRRLLNPNEE